MAKRKRPDVDVDSPDVYVALQHVRILPVDLCETLHVDKEEEEIDKIKKKCPCYFADHQYVQSESILSIITYYGVNCDEKTDGNTNFIYSLYGSPEYTKKFVEVFGHLIKNGEEMFFKSVLIQCFNCLCERRIYLYLNVKGESYHEENDLLMDAIAKNTPKLNQRKASKKL